jgi:hypothetical protein
LTGTTGAQGPQGPTGPAGKDGQNGNDAAMTVKYVHEYRTIATGFLGERYLQCPADFPIILGGGCGDYSQTSLGVPVVRFNGPRLGRSDSWQCTVFGTSGTPANPSYFSIMAICGKGTAANKVPDQNVPTN